ncbi:hypothetical protein Q9Q94_10885 [Uliginosibacterium sp. 31-16]|uniref:hypothetical protein n=1 Tax=Uliginosibacterium sp. 31-16 TaxID=3068315 RepID=UPI00273D0DA3|nr:hypothetical protein [Uliginosibacterium sp. 31-16]MDP5240039.1 hypothetical protein [Uliginosibacterium sp. 31-16]
MNARPNRLPLRAFALAWLALPLLAACAVLPSPGLQRAKAGEALFEDRCKNVAGIKIYKTVADVEGIVLLKVRPTAGDREWADPMWPGAAFAGEAKEKEYIDTFLWYENAFGTSNSPRLITPKDRGYISSNPSDHPGYRYVDVVDAATGKRERFSGFYDRPWERDPERYSSKNLYSFWKLKHEPAPADGPRYGVTYEDHVIPEERALGLASSTVKVLDLKTNEVLGEMTRYAWTSASPNPANPTPWLTARTCGSGFNTRETQTRLFVDQVLQPRKDK